MGKSKLDYIVNFASMFVGPSTQTSAGTVPAVPACQHPTGRLLLVPDRQLHCSQQSGALCIGIEGADM